MQEEILRQIREEGILDGIDLDNLDVSQEDELSERIAEAYRRRHRVRARQQEDTSDRPLTPDSREQSAEAPEQRHHRRPGRSPNPPDTSAHSSHPPFQDPIYSKHTLQAKAIDEEHPASTDGRLRLRRLHTPAELHLTRKDKRHAQLQIFRIQQEQFQIKESALQTFLVIADARQTQTVYDFVGKLGIRHLERHKTQGALGRDPEQSHQRRLTLPTFHHHSHHRT